jgi:hypothetical protein
MSPSECSHSGLSFLLSASISGEMSVSVHVNLCFRCEALLPPPEPSSSNVRAGPSTTSSTTRDTNAASSE